MTAVRALLDTMRERYRGTLNTAVDIGRFRLPRPAVGAFCELLADALATDVLNAADDTTIADASARATAHSLALVEAYCRGRRDERALMGLKADTAFRPDVIGPDVSPCVVSRAGLEVE